MMVWMGMDEWPAVLRPTLTQLSMYSFNFFFGDAENETTELGHMLTIKKPHEFSDNTEAHTPWKNMSV